MKRSNILGTTARKHVTGGMNATKRMNNWSAISATSGESVRGASTNGGNTTAITKVIATTPTKTAIDMVTRTPTDPPPQITQDKWNWRADPTRTPPPFFSSDSELLR